jgi:hypothetical protein
MVLVLQRTLLLLTPAPCTKMIYDVAQICNKHRTICTLRSHRTNLYYVILYYLHIVQICTMT